jgi:hypothetical protein
MQTKLAHFAVAEASAHRSSSGWPPAAAVGRRSRRDRARHPGAVPPRCRGGEALLQAAAEGSAVCAAGPGHRQARQLRGGEARVDAKRRTPQEPLPEQSRRELASTDAAPRTADAALQVSTTSPALPICTRLHLWPLSSTTPSDDRAEVSGGSFCGLQGLEPGDVRPDGSINASCSMLLPKIRPQLVKLTMPASASSRAAGRLADRCLLTSSAGTATVRSCVSRIFQRRATTCRSRVNLYSNCLGRTSIRGVACRRCRPAARLAQPIGSGISHVCFRYVVRAGGSTLKGNGP